MSITQWPRYPLDGLPTRTGGELNALDMMEHLDDLRYAVAHPEEARPNPTGSMGNPCSFCPNREEIPASGWLTSWKWGRLPTCWEGAVHLLRTGQLKGSNDE